MLRDVFFVGDFWVLTLLWRLLKLFDIQRFDFFALKFWHGEGFRWEKTRCFTENMNLINPTKDFQPCWVNSCRSRSPRTPKKNKALSKAYYPLVSLHHKVKLNPCWPSRNFSCVHSDEKVPPGKYVCVDDIPFAGGMCDRSPEISYEEKICTVHRM